MKQCAIRRVLAAVVLATASLAGGGRSLGMWVATGLMVDEDELMVEVKFSPELAPELMKMNQILVL